jgi:hypothetical protein
VDKTDRGLFTEIAQNLPGYEHVMFDYNNKDSDGLVVTTPLNRQAEILKDTYEKIKLENPTADISLVCHSQGCLAAALAQLPARKTIFLAPPLQTSDSDDKIRRLVQDRPGTEVLENGDTKWPRSDGSATIITKEYWDSYDTLPVADKLYNSLGGITEITIFVAMNDEILGRSDLSGLSKNIEVVPVGTGHNFENVRGAIAKSIGGILK